MTKKRGGVDDGVEGGGDRGGRWWCKRWTSTDVLVSVQV